MRRWILGVVIVVAALAAVAGGAAYAAYRTSARNGEWVATVDSYGPMMGWREGGRGLGFEQGAPRLAPGVAGLREDLLGAMADGLGLTQETLSSRLDAGESLASIAEAQDMTDEELQALWESSWETAARSAVEDGRLTEAQANWILEHIGSADVAYGWGMMRRPMLGVWGRGMRRGSFAWPQTP